MARKRNRRRHNKVHKRLEKNVTLNENLKAQLKEARADRDEYVQKEQSIKTSSAAKRAKERNSGNPAELTLCVGNLPYSTTALQLVIFLWGRLVGSKVANCLSDDTKEYDEKISPITLCKIPHPPEPKRRRPYFAFVTVSDVKYKDALLELNNIARLEGRPLRIGLSRRKHEMRTGHDATALRCQVSKICLGYPEYSHLSAHKHESYERLYGNGSNNGPWRVHWESEPGSTVAMEVNGLEHIISFEYRKRSHLLGSNDEIFRVECLMKFTQGQIRVELANSKQWVLSILLRTPPKVYRQTTQSDSSDTQGRSIMQYPVLYEGIRNDYLWQLGGTSGQFNKEWMRTVDFSGGAFGRCMLYRVFVDRSNAAAAATTTTRLFKYLKSCGLIRNSVPESAMERLSTMKSLLSLGLVEPGWSGTVDTDKLFQSLHPDVKYLIQCLTSQNRLDFVSDEMRAIEFVTYAEKRVELVLYALEEMEKDWSVPFYFNPAKVLAKHLSRLTLNEDVAEDDAESHLVSGVYVRRVSITPLRVVCHAPELSPSNRVLRHFPSLRHRFIRVTFTDESLVSFIHAMSTDTLHRRMAVVLREGVFVAGRRYVFLAYSNSQLREQSCWMYDEDPDFSDDLPPSADTLRQQLGNFDHLTSSPSRHGSRLGQCFSDTVDALMLDDSQWQLIEDIEKNGYCFSDGVGRISKSMSKEIATKLGINDIPSAYQIRFAGFKGVLTTTEMPVDSGSGKLHVQFRPSMQKFDSPHRVLEVVTPATYIPTYLNRQLIMLLSGLGIMDGVFLRLQENMFDSLETLVSDYGTATKFLSLLDSTRGTSVIEIVCDLLGAGFNAFADPYLLGLLRALREQLLHDVINRARILVKNGVTLIGVMDETGELEEGTVFVQYQSKGMNRPIILNCDTVLVGRNPSLHPGDLRLLRAVDVPHLHHLVNVVVFPCNGHRPSPTEMSGGDLDGDIYFVIWDKSLLPSRTPTPMSPSDLLAPADTENVGAINICDWFVKYVENDRLGIIAVSHLVQADVQPDGIFSEPCLELARLHSVAVDFAKTGVPAHLSNEVRAPRIYPDFMQNQSRPSYESQGPLGKLFRAAKGRAFAAEKTAFYIDKDLIIPGHEEFLAEAIELRDEYNDSLWQLMCHFGIQDEEEICSGYVREFKRRDGQKPKKPEEVIHRMQMAYKKLKSDFRNEFRNGLSDYFVDSDGENDKKWWALLKASAW
eukprot:CAMPEP_0116022626 /NCGR_PEP_ID=MMETSP0321-20121206/11096_1 /TAXON_ID=163516 /ORGANISM="Leptocylindrus danicus var. danicus, Strain B650" /LENGTH=1212 /DNA_ID=CAMNT_0003493727 /DNA_START=209 /DNA_END=3844 /DNA_ORIENTATION=+